MEAKPMMQAMKAARLFASVSRTSVHNRGMSAGCVKLSWCNSLGYEDEVNLFPVIQFMDLDWLIFPICF
jgi:hypothetical protein